MKIHPRGTEDPRTGWSLPIGGKEALLAQMESYPQSTGDQRTGRSVHTGGEVAHHTEKSHLTSTSITPIVHIDIRRGLIVEITAIDLQNRNKMCLGLLVIMIEASRPCLEAEDSHSLMNMQLILGTNVL